MIDSMNKPIKINANTLPFIYYKMVSAKMDVLCGIYDANAANSF